LIKSGYVRVTEVLDFFPLPELVDWKLKVGKKTAGLISRAAMKHGSEVDSIIKGTIKESKTPKPEVKSALVAFNKWKADFGVTTDLIFPERRYDEVMKVTGEPDCLWGNYLIDFKCATSIKPNYWVQLAVYNSMLEEPKPKLAVLRLDKNLGVYQFRTHEQEGVNPDQCRSVFRGLLAAYRYYRPNGSLEE